MDGLQVLQLSAIQFEKEKRMNQRQDNWKYFQDTFPEVHQAYEEYGKAIHEKGGPLNERERCLIKVAVAAASQFDYALRSHVEKALSAGCTISEIEHAILLTAPTVGFPRMMSALMVFRDEEQGLV